MLIQRAVTLDGAAVDLRVGERIDEVADTLTARPGEDVLDAAGGTVLPGLHDHHVHLHSAAAAATLATGRAAAGTRSRRTGRRADERRSR